MKIRARKSQSRLTIKIYLRLRSFDPEGAIGYFDHANMNYVGDVNPAYMTSRSFRSASVVS